MRRAISLLLILFSLTLSAEQRTDVDLKAALDAMAEGSVMTLSCSVSGTSPQGPVSGSGKIVYGGNAFAFLSESFRVYDDGRTRWTVNGISKEATAESSSQDFLNTDALLRLCGFNPKSARVSFDVDSSGRIESLNASLKNGTGVKVRFKILKKEKKDDSSYREQFSFDSRSLDSSWVVTDLR